MLLWIAFILSTFVGGLSHTITGFGSATLMMAVVPHFMNVVPAAAICSLTGTSLSLSLFTKNLKGVRLKKVLLPLALYTATSVSLLQVVKGINIRVMGILFGIFYLILGLYYLLFSKKARIPDTTAAVIFCSVLSGLCSACFGVGGPLMSLLFLERFPSREEYSANLQLLFAATGIVNAITRIVKGIFTVDMLPYLLVGIAVIFFSRFVGLKIARKLSPEVLRKAAYVAVMVSGFLTILKYI